LNVKDAILDASVALLKDKGIAALTQPQVARAAGIKQSHLTYYFPTRADLLLGVAEHSISVTMAQVGTRLRDHAEPATIASVVADLMISGIPPRLIIGLIVAADAEPGIRESLDRFIKTVRERMRDVLASAGLAANAPAVLLFHATIVGLAVMHQARLSPESAREIKDGVAAILQLLAPPTPILEGSAT